MESRKITVVDNRTNNTKAFNSTAETLAELKRDMTANNINTENCVFFEALTKSELTDDASILPTNVPYRGTTTNNLVFMLTGKNLKIDSGLDIPKDIKKEDLTLGQLRELLQYALYMLETLSLTADVCLDVVETSQLAESIPYTKEELDSILNR